MWAGILDPAIRHEKHSAERGAAVRAIASKRHMLPSGRWVTFSERTILRKLDAYERHGMAGLSRPKRADAGANQVFGNHGSQRPAADEQHPCSSQPILAGMTHVREERLTMVSVRRHWWAIVAGSTKEGRRL